MTELDLLKSQIKSLKEVLDIQTQVISYLETKHSPVNASFQYNSSPVTYYIPNYPIYPHSSALLPDNVVVLPLPTSKK